MTHFSAAIYFVDALGHKGIPSTNPERDMALQAQARTRGFLAWLRGSAIGKRLADRLAKRALDRAIARLAATSPHLLADIGMVDASEEARNMMKLTRLEAASDEARVSARPIPAPAPFAPRPAMRPTIVAPVGKPAPASIARPVTLR